MAWSPTYTVINARAIADNLLTYCLDSTRQSDAWTWAGGTGTYRAVSKFSDTVGSRGTPAFPAIQFLDDEDAVDYENDVLQGVYIVTFEMMVQSGVLATAISDARTYAIAFTSMIRNCPAATLGASTGATAATVRLMGLETGFDPIKTNEKQNDFLQTLKIRATFQLAVGSQ